MIKQRTPYTYLLGTLIALLILTWPIGTHAAVETNSTDSYTVKSDGYIYNNNAPSTPLTEVDIISGGSITFENDIACNEQVVNGTLILNIAIPVTETAGTTLTVPANGVSVVYSSAEHKVLWKYNYPVADTYYIFGGELRDLTVGKNLVPLETVLNAGATIIAVDRPSSITVDGTGNTITWQSVYNVPAGGPYRVTSNSGGVAIASEAYIPPAPPMPPVPESAPAHIHSYGWVQLGELSYTTDGYAEYRCSCGDVLDKQYMTAYAYCVEDSIRKIKEAPSGSTLVVDTVWWNTYPQRFMQTINDRPDVNIMLCFEYNHEKHITLFPIGHTVDTSHEWYGVEWF